MTDTKIELGKQYRTRDGREVRIYAVGDFGVHGAMLEDDCWQVAGWHADGGWSSPSRHERHDLIEVKPQITRTYWLVHVREMSLRRIGAVFDTEEDARAYTLLSSSHLPQHYLAITGPHTVTFTEGEGL